MTHFTASVQYNDLTGTVAADNADGTKLAVFLKSEGLAKPNEVLVGFRVTIGENHGHEVENVVLVAYLFETAEFVESPPEVRAVEVNIPTAKFFSFLKRFDLVLTNGAMDLSNTNIDGPYY